MMAALLVAIFLLETIAAIALPPTLHAPLSGGKSRDRVGVLIPAHDEEETLPETIAEIKPQLRDGDRLLVVADNCSDDTAAVAKSLGAEVIVRIDLNNRGKGFALDCGISPKSPPKLSLWSMPIVS
jgi:cellulose synthase/poly-beta-1,6-N-acetylglucosamine synthase-like glycosyltransferase